MPFDGIETLLTARISEVNALCASSRMAVQLSTLLRQQLKGDTADIRQLVADAYRLIEESRRVCRRAGVTLWDWP